MQHWYYLLVPNTESKTISLFEHYREIQDSNIIVCWQLEHRKYSIFQDLVDFSNFFQTIKSNETCFYEVIRDGGQKIYFDIDSTTKILPLKDCTKVVNVITTELANLLLEYSNKFLIQVFESHSSEKISFHIVVDKVCVPNVKHNRIFYNKLMERLEDISVEELPHLYVPSLFDASMYKRIQQYRTVLSTKYQQTRFKMPCYELYVDHNLKFGHEPPGKNNKSMILNMMRSGFVSVLAGCDYIFLPEAEVVHREFATQEGTIEITKDYISQALDLYMQKSPEDGGRLPFRVSGEYADDNKHCIVTLERLRPSWCQSCKRKHSTENPYLLFWSDEIHVSFDCRRNEHGERLFLGTLNQNKPMKPEFVSVVAHPMKNKLMDLFKSY